MFRIDETPIYYGPDERPEPEDTRDWRDLIGEAQDEAQRASRSYHDDDDASRKLRKEYIDLAIDSLRLALERLP